MLKRKQFFIQIRDWGSHVSVAYSELPITERSHIRPGQGSSNPILSLYPPGKEIENQGGSDWLKVTKRLWLKLRCPVIHDHRLSLRWNLSSLPHIMCFIAKFTFSSKLSPLLSEWVPAIYHVPNPGQKSTNQREKALAGPRDS